jgi:integrase
MVGMSHDFVTVRWQKLREAAGVPKARLHDLRHFTGTLLINLGVDVKTVQAILRHSNPMTTLTRYVHEVPQSSRDAVERLGAAIAAK